ncbi:MAG: hypothetical protein KF712_19030 [Akkermansiaceae bacterium]|nr:hypothetical protein [Akkermansiaceae bacterium]
MKATAKFMTITLAAGCLLGAVIPLPPSKGKASAAPSVATARSGVNSNPGKEAHDLDGITAADAAAAATTDPRGFFQALLKADPQPSREIVEAFFNAWIAANPDAAFQAALLLPGRFGYEGRSQFFPRQVQELFQTHPLVALRWVGRIEGVMGHDITLHTRIDRLDELRQLDPQEVSHWLNRCPVGGVSAGMAKTFAEALAKEDPAAAIRWAESLNAEYQNVVLPMMLHHLRAKDPQAAMEYVRNAPSHVRQHVTLFAMQADSAGTILGQMKWLAGEMGVTSHSGINSLLGSLYNKSPETAIAHVVAMEGTTQGVDAARGLGTAACLYGPAAKAVNMIAKLPDSLQADAFRSAMLFRMPGDFPAFLGPLADGSIQGANLDAYIRELVGFVDGERGTSFGRPQITWGVAESPQQLEAFQKWIGDHPGPQRDKFIRQTIEVLRDRPELRDKVFGNLPPEEMKRIMEER